MQGANDAEFFEIFQSEVVHEVDELLDLNLRSKRYRINLYPSLEEEDRIKALVKAHSTGKNNLPNNFTEWFALAYVAGLALNCREIHDKILVRTPLGYEEWERLVGAYPLEFLQTKIKDRRIAFENAKSMDPGLASHLLESPIIIRESPKEIKDIAGLIRTKDLLKYLCPALQSATEDAFEITKVITPILLSLTLLGTITLPLAPTLIASIAVFISKMSIASLCVDYPAESKSKK